MKKGSVKLNKCIALFVLLTMAICFAVPMAVNAATERHSDTLHLYQEGDFSEFIEEEYNMPTGRATTLSVTDHPIIKTYNDLNRNEKKIFDKLNNADDYIDFFSTDNVTFEWGKKMLTGIINDFPQFFYVSSSFDYSTNKITGKVTGIWPKYSMEKSEIEGAKTIFNKGVEKALATVDDSMDDAQKALVIHDYLLSNSYYADDDKYIAHSAYGIFYNRRTVCAGYALAYSYILNKLGIPCQYMYSEEMAHAWNVVQIDGSWYQCDLTWDDTSARFGVNVDAYGIVCHEYFLKSKDYMTNHSHKGFLVRIDDLETDSKKYDYAFWNDVNTVIPVYKGEYYYPDPSASGNQTKVIIKKVNKNMGETVLLNTPQYCESDGNFVACCLTILDGKLFMANSPSSYRGIYCIKNGMTYKVANLDAAPVGLYVEDNQLCYEIKTNSYSAILDKKYIFKKSVTTKWYKNGMDPNYNIYADVNNDGVITAKDYVIIKNQLKK